MKDIKIEDIERHIKTHSIRSVEDQAAVKTLEYFLSSNGTINTNFNSYDTWPNIDGTFEFVSNPAISRRPAQNFFAQIKGTHCDKEYKGGIKYSLKSLAFPAFIYKEVTLDPGILFVVVNPDIRGSERVFWKYMSTEFISSIDYSNDSATIIFTSDDEIENTKESVDVFCSKLAEIIDHHSFVKKLDNRDLTFRDIEKIIKSCDAHISNSIDRLDFYNDARDNVSQTILTKLDDLCTATLLLNTLKMGYTKVNIRLAWEQSLLNIKTKYLGTFLKGLKYIGNRIPDEGQSERLMLKYYDFLWQIRAFLKDAYDISVLNNLEKFPLNTDELDKQYYSLVADAFNSIPLRNPILKNLRYYIQKKTPFYIGTQRYYEITLQLSGMYATKYNRITIYTKENISTNYSIQIGYEEATIDLWGIASNIKIVTAWRVSIDPVCLNKLSKALRKNTRISSHYGEYNSLMNFLTVTGINLLELIDLQEIGFSNIIDNIYDEVNTAFFKDILLHLRENYSKSSKKRGRNVIRYLLLNLREETLESILANKFTKKLLCDELYISSKCIPFEKHPFISNLAGHNTSNVNSINQIISVSGYDEFLIFRPYLYIENQIKNTGEIYFGEDLSVDKECIEVFNKQLDNWERNQGYQIKVENGLIYIDSYEKTTVDILQKLRYLSLKENKGQKEFNQNYLKNCKIIFSDPLKENTLKNAFVSSKVLVVYGAAGTGKTTLINYISNLMSGRSKLFLTKTHTALQNLKRCIENAGANSDFISIDSFTKRVNISDYDIIFIDECSTIDNRTMLNLLNKLAEDTFLVLSGDIHQIESINFGNWFFYAKDIINTHGSNVELLNTWRTEDKALINLWNEVREKNPLIIEKLAIDGPFSEDIGPEIFEKYEKDEVVLCLNYDGKFGLNNMNSYFQSANMKSKAFLWQEWTYKIGDPILFNDTKRFSILYNNLKGRIADIKLQENSINFTVDVETIITDNDCKKDGLDFIGVFDSCTRIRFSVYGYDDTSTDDEIEQLRAKSVVPFQLAYAVSIHKAQGLEYDSVKIIIPSNNSEKITHGIFYTAITRAKKKLKIYWSSETMKEIVQSFSYNQPENTSLKIVKAKIDSDN